MPHSDLSARDTQGRRCCPYCGYPISDGRLTCPYHADLLRLEPLDDKWTLTEDDLPSRSRQKGSLDGTAREFRIGDRVLIAAETHPWVGRTGHIVSKYAGRSVDWIVELDDPAGQRVAVTTFEIRSNPRGI